MHSRAFKKPWEFAGKRVMVVGFGNTAADTATALANVAKTVYIAHRNGARIVSLLSLDSTSSTVSDISATSQSQRQTY